eukprot:COSAG01_NODE_36240_length_520_cov_0.995249_1_plen_46_part_10
MIAGRVVLEARGHRVEGVVTARLHTITTHAVSVYLLPPPPPPPPPA